MRIVVKYMAQLKHAAGSASETVEVESTCSAEAILRQLADKHGDSYRRLVLDAQGSVQPALLLFVGDEQVRAEAPRAFHEGDVLTVLAPMSGG
jgi:molybdopterin converting factor small subunit